MSHVLQNADLTRREAGTLRFEGANYGADVSFFLIDNNQDQGPDQHRHPYAEVFIVRAGAVRFKVGADVVDASPGDIVVVEAGEESRLRERRPGQA